MVTWNVILSDMYKSNYSKGITKFRVPKQCYDNTPVTKNPLDMYGIYVGSVYTNTRGLSVLSLYIFLTIAQ